jgi:hypothetical protein
LAPQDKSGSGRKGKPEHKVLVSGSIQAYPPPEIEKKRDAERKQDTATHEAERQVILGRETHKIWLERLTLAAVVIYAGIAWWQGCLTRTAIRVSGEQFLLDQRPWLSPKTVPINGLVRSGYDMLVNLDVENTGKSPAIHSHGSVQACAEVCPDTFPPENVPITRETPPFTYKTIFPGRSQTGEALTYSITQPMIDGLNAGRCGFYVWGMIHYCDVAGYAHYQNFCWKWNKGTPAEFDVCTTYNDGDQDHPQTRPQPCPQD